MNKASPVRVWIALFIMVGCTSTGGGSAGGMAEIEAAPAAQPAATTVFRCGQTMVRAGYEGRTLELRIDGRTYRLGQVEAASGAKYASEGADRVVFWNKGKEAALTVGDQA